MARRYWTEAQHARKKRASSIQKSRRGKSRGKPSRSAAAQRGWETRRKKARAEERARRARAKKAAQTRAKRSRALANQEKKTKRAVVEIQKAKAQGREEKKKAKSQRAKEKAEERAIANLLEPKKYLEEQLDHAILKKYGDKKRKRLTPAEAEELRRRARPKIRKLFRRVIKQALISGEIEPLSEPLGVIISKDGFKSTGSLIHVRMGFEMNEKAVEEALYRAGDAAKTLYQHEQRKLWYAVLTISSLGRKLYVGGAIKFKESRNPIERLVMLDSHPSTGLQDSMINVLASLRVKLEDLLDEGTITLLRYVTVRTFDFKTKEERSEWRKKYGENFAPEPTKQKKFKRRAKPK